MTREEYIKNLKNQGKVTVKDLAELLTCHRSEGWRYRGALWAERNRHLRWYHFPERCALGSHQGQGMAAL